MASHAFRGKTNRTQVMFKNGGIAYVYDPRDEFLPMCNLGMVELEELADVKEINDLRDMIDTHQRLTGSTVAEAILTDWDRCVSRFHRVIPSDYKRALAEIEEEKHMASASTDGETVDLPGGVVVPTEPAAKQEQTSS